MVERCVWDADVAGSNPVSPTNLKCPATGNSSGIFLCVFGVLWLDTAFVDGCGLTHVVRSDCWVGVEVFSVMGGFWWVAGRGRRADTCRKAESSLSSPKGGAERLLGWGVVFSVMGGFWWVAGRGRRADTCRKAESSLSSPKGWLVVFAVCDAERVGPFFSRSLRVARCLEIVII